MAKKKDKNECPQTPTTKNSLSGSCLAEPVEEKGVKEAGGTITAACPGAPLGTEGLGRGQRTRVVAAVHVCNTPLWLLPGFSAMVGLLTHISLFGPLLALRSLSLGPEHLKTQPHSWFLGQLGLRGNKQRCPGTCCQRSQWSTTPGPGHLLAFPLQFVWFSNFTKPSHLPIPVSLSF